MIRRGTAYGLATAAGLAGCVWALAATVDATVPFPDGYRHWIHIDSMVVGPKSGTFAKQPCEKPCTGGIYHFYANELAMEGYRTGKFADGAVLADELLETRALGDSAVNGPRRGVGVMVRDSQRYRDTGGWGFASFEGNSHTEKLTAEEKRACFTCHLPRKDHSYVFTEFHEQ